MPFIFCIGWVYSMPEIVRTGFRITPMMVIQIILLTFPVCLFIFGLNDIQDHMADRNNPRKKGIDGHALPTQQHKIIKIAALATGGLFFLVSIATTNMFNIYCSVSLLVLSYTYSVTPWRLKTRPPLDVICGGLIGFFRPFRTGLQLCRRAAPFPSAGLLLYFLV